MRYRALLIFWLLADLVIFVASYALAYGLRVGFILSSDFPFQQHLVAALLAAPFWLLVLATTRTFHLTRAQTSLRNAAYIAYASLVGVAVFTLVYYFQFNAFFSRLLLIEAFVLSSILIWVWHIAYGYVFRMILRLPPPVFPTVIVGVTRESRALIATLKRKKHPFVPVAVLDTQGVKDKDISGTPFVGRLNKLEETLTKYRPTHLIHCSDMEQSLNLLSACQSRGIAYIVLPSVFGIIGRDERVESLAGHPVTVVPPKNSKLNWFFR